MRLTMSKVSRRRTNQFCDFVPVLKFGAVDFHDRAGRTEQYLCSRLYNSCLSTTRWTQKQKVRDRPAGRRQSGLKNLKELHQCPDPPSRAEASLSSRSQCCCVAIELPSPFVRSCGPRSTRYANARGLGNPRNCSNWNWLRPPCFFLPPDALSNVD